MGRKQKLKLETKKSNKTTWFWIAGICLFTLLAFYPAINNGFTNWDDEPYIIENYNLQELSFEKIKYWLTAYHHGNYHPLTMLSYLVEYHFEQLNPKIYHVNNLILHLLNVVLCFWFIQKLTNKRNVAIIVALFFGIHPMHVESVAWVSERKDVLYTAFFLGGLIQYLKYIKTEKTKDLIWVGVLFLLSILSKPAALTFSITLPLIDYFKGRSFDKKAILEKIPFVVLSIIFGIIALKAQEAAEAIADAETFTLWQRTMFASYGLLAYVQKMFLPTGLSCYHPYPTLDKNGMIPLIFYVAPFIILLALGGVLYLMKRQNKLIPFGVFFYVFNLVLVLQFISIGNAIIAERYTYVPYIGLFTIVGFGFNHILEKLPKYKIPTIAFVIGVSCFFAYKTNARTKDWKGAFELWDSFVKVYPLNDFGRIKRGTWLAQNGQEAEGLKDFEWIAKQNPNHIKALLGIANISGKTGNTKKALEAFNKILEIQPNFFEARVNRAITYSILGEYQKAFEDYKVAEKLEPNNLKIFMNRAYARFQAKQYEGAVSDYSKVIAVDKNNFTNYFYRGVAYLNLGKYNKAIEDFSKALKLNPKFANCAINRSICYEKTGNYKQALSDLLLAQKLGKKVPKKNIERLKALANKQ